MNAYTEDLKRARELRDSQKYFHEKYPRLYTSDAAGLVNALEIAEQYNIPIDNLYCHGNGVISLSGRTGSFEFVFRNSYNFAYRATDYKIDASKLYVHLSFGGCGRLNLVSAIGGNSSYLYEGEFQEEWENFLDKILSYHPVQYDDVNNEYFFTVPDGYRLFCDFPEILSKAEEKFDKLNAKRKIERLKKQIEELENA